MSKKFIFCLSVVLLVSFCSTVFAGADTLLAKAGERKITAADFDRFISSFPQDKQKALAENPKNKEILLRRLVQVIVFSDIARARGLDKDERIKQQMDYYAEEVLAQEVLRQEIAKIVFTDEDIKTYYRANEKSFSAPEMVKARHILVKVNKAASDEEIKNAVAKTEDILKKLKAGESFQKLAEALSDDPGSRVKGGDLGFFARGRMVKPFEEAAFSLKAGEVSGPVRTDFGFHVIKVEEKKEAGIEPFDKVKEKVRTKLVEEATKERTKDLLENAFKAANVEIYPELIQGEKK